MNVVILGGGFCGAMVAKKLDRQKDLNVTLIDTREYFEYLPSLWKLLLHPLYHQHLMIPYNKFLKRTRIITDSLCHVTPEFIETKKETLPYEYLVISTGIDYPIFLKNKKNVFTIKSGTEIIQYSEKVANATTILIIGGGLIGTEVAGALARTVPEKQIILIHPHDRLLERNTKAVSQYAKKYLNEHGVQLIFNEKVIDHKRGIFITNAQRNVKADLGICCAGISANPWFMKNFSSAVYTEHNALKVNQFLQLEGYPNIFVGGDITSIPEEKTAACADRHGHLISENILRALKQKPFIVYKPRKEPMVISLGNGDGILTYPPFVIPGFIPAILKLLVEKIGIKRLF
jgi:NADH dehydrogenase FAD-containing subunit